MKFIAYYDSPLGKITLAGDEAGLCGLWFEGEKYYAHALTASGTDGKFCARDIAAKTDAAARKGCYEKRGCALEAKSGADKKRDSADLLAKEQRAASETQRDFAAYDAGKNLAPPIFRRKAGAENSAQTSKADTSRRETWSFSIKLGAGSICILADSGRVLRPL